MKRNRISYSVLLVALIAAGLGTRRYGEWLPEIIAIYGGDTLWALMVFVGLGIVAPSRSTRWVGLTALVLSYGVEFSQLYQAAWLNQLRQSTAVGLVLGRGFLWSDLVCYTLGISIGVAVEYGWQQRRRSQSPSTKISP